MKVHTTFAAVLIAAIAGCSNAGPQAAGTFRTHASYDQLFSAAMAATPAVGYHATSVNRTDGLITAEQGVVMGHDAVGMTAEIMKQGNVRILRVTFIAPPGTFAMGDFGQNVDDYISAVRDRVPDLQAAQ